MRLFEISNQLLDQAHSVFDLDLVTPKPRCDQKDHSVAAMKFVQKGIGAAEVRSKNWLAIHEACAYSSRIKFDSRPVTDTSQPPNVGGSIGSLSVFRWLLPP